MNLLKQVINEIHDLLSKNNINEVIDLRISNLDSYDYQINNLVKYQNHSGIDEIIKQYQNLLILLILLTNSNLQKFIYKF